MVDVVRSWREQRCCRCEEVPVDYLLHGWPTRPEVGVARSTVCGFEDAGLLK